MQTLQFEAKWEKAIAPQDRQYIKELFEKTKSGSQSVQCEIIRQAWNYKSELLVSVLIHNFTAETLLFKKQDVHIMNENEQILQCYTIPQLEIATHTSTPWTFIVKNAPAAFVASQVLIPVSP